MPKATEIEIRCAAEAMVERFGDKAAIEAANWANAAYDRGEMAKYEFWQWVCMDINERNFQKARARMKAN